MSDVLQMEVRQSRLNIERYEKEKYDQYMHDKIDFFIAHGVDVLKPDCKVTIYQDWVREKQNEKYDREIEQIGEKTIKEKVLSVDNDIDSIIKDKQHGRKTRTSRNPGKRAAGSLF